MAINQGKMISASDFQVKTIASLSEVTSFSVSYSNSPTITLGTFSIPSDIYFSHAKGICSMSGGSPNTWQANTSVTFNVTPREYTHQNSCMLHRSSSGNIDESISVTRYSMEDRSEFLSDSNPPKPQVKFQMYVGGDSSWSQWALDLGTTYTVTVTISQSSSTSYTYNDVTFKFYLWLY